MIPTFVAALADFTSSATAFFCALSSLGVSGAVFLLPVAMGVSLGVDFGVSFADFFALFVVGVLVAGVGAVVFKSVNVASSYVKG